MYASRSRECKLPHRRSNLHNRHEKTFVTEVEIALLSGRTNFARQILKLEESGGCSINHYGSAMAARLPNPDSEQGS
jgi:hypothetical protein